MKSDNISIIILAAGSSTRLGTPKQLLPYQNKSLIRHICDVALQSNANSVYVILGSQLSRMKEEIRAMKVNLIENPNWRQGISSSIRTGVQALPNSVDAAVILLCDQPKVTTSLIDTLIDSYLSTHQLIIACQYGNTIGVPALFDRSIFPELLALEGDAGAKQIITKHTAARLLIDFPVGIYDIDSPDDSQSLR